MCEYFEELSSSKNNAYTTRTKMIYFGKRCWPPDRLAKRIVNKTPIKLTTRYRSLLSVFQSLGQAQSRSEHFWEKPAKTRQVSNCPGTQQSCIAYMTTTWRLKAIAALSVTLANPTLPREESTHLLISNRITPVVMVSTWLPFFAQSFCMQSLCLWDICPCLIDFKLGLQA